MYCGKLLVASCLVDACSKFSQPRRYRRMVLMGFFMLLSHCTLQGPTQVITLRPGEILARSGDTVYSLARLHSVSVRSLVRANGLKAPYTLCENQKLVLPCGERGKSKGFSGSNGSETEFETSGSEKSERTGPKLVDSDVEWSDVKDQELNAKLPPAPNPASPSLMEEVKRSAPESSKQSSTNQPSANRQVDRHDKKPLNSLVKSTGAMVFVHPIKGQVVQRFDLKKRQHGIYLSASPKEAVHASADGEVLFTGVLDNGDPMVVIKHSQGWLTAYGPLDRICVEKGQRIQSQSVIGDVKGSKLYFQMRKDRAVVDPCKYLSNH